jgi:hypothetical protein
MTQQKLDHPINKTTLFHYCLGKIFGPQSRVESILIARRTASARGRARPLLCSWVQPEGIELTLPFSRHTTYAGLEPMFLSSSDEEVRGRLRYLNLVALSKAFEVN